MTKILDENLIEVLAILPAGWQLSSYRRSPHGWTAELVFKNQHFLLVSEWGYIDVAEMIGKKRKRPRTIEPPEDQRSSISASQVCHLLTNAAEVGSRPHAE